MLYTFLPKLNKTPAPSALANNIDHSVPVKVNLNLSFSLERINNSNIKIPAKLNLRVRIIIGWIWLSNPFERTMLVPTHTCARKRSSIDLALSHDYNFYHVCVVILPILKI